MKKLTLTLIAAAALAVGTVNLSKAEKSTTMVCTELTNVSKISKIEVRGNVEVYVSDGNTDNVKVYNRYYSESALVQNNNGVLRISSYNNQKLVVWVTLSDLQAISAYDNAEVKSFGKLSEIGLDVNLYNNAYANLDIEGYSASITVNDKAKADLSGNVSTCDLKYNIAATVNQTNFIAAAYTQTRTGIPVNIDENQELTAL